MKGEVSMELRASNAIGYASLEEWEANAPKLMREVDATYLSRMTMPVYATLVNRVQPGTPIDTQRWEIRISRLDETGNIHYWQLHTGTYPTHDGVRPMFDQDVKHADSGRIAFKLVLAWLGAHGFGHIVNAQISMFKDLVMVDGHCDFLYCTKDGWIARETALIKEPGHV